MMARARHCGSKRAVLQRLVGVSLVGDDEPIPMIDRPIVQAMIREPDQRRQIQLLAQQSREIAERVGPVWWVMRAAEQGDPEIASMVKDGIKGRFNGMSQFTVVLASKGPLRQGLTTSAAAETVWAITSPDMHRLLTRGPRMVRRSVREVDGRYAYSAIAAGLGTDQLSGLDAARGDRSGINSQLAPTFRPNSAANAAAETLSPPSARTLNTSTRPP